MGWILVPFHDEKGVIITNRTSDYLLQPGTPYEESVFAEDPGKEETLRSRVQNMLFGKQPQVTVRIAQPNRNQNNKLETLPDIIVGLCGYLPLMSLYWEMLGNVLFGSLSTNVKDSVYLRQVPPSCALLPYVADTPLLMEALRKKTDLVLSLLRQTQTDPIKFYMNTDYKFLAFTTREFTCPIRITG
ncbi:unnamed protein product [Echinostoma caproni]|uniref:Uncharacterized protein n=1 Tax=Echinostoma caproni TaxID=27848 RepID=A0A3P8GUM5_9TREM|nr:unnamed protein product [Echinostoma caproni]